MILAGCGLLDVITRIAVDFNMILVSASEAMLFGIAAAAMVWAADRHDGDDRTRKTHLIIAGLLGLAALRAGLWAASGNVQLANAAVLVAGAVIVLGLRRYRNRRTPNGPESQD